MVFDFELFSQFLVCLEPYTSTIFNFMIYVILELEYDPIVF
jgi:hypothetical protein